MIKNFTSEAGLPGFTYYPLLEIGTGIFLFISSIVVPALYLYYNGVKLQNWGELLFCAGFFLLFFFMGKSLIFQSLTVQQTSKGFYFYQNLREPAVTIECDKYGWEGIKTEDAQIGEETYVVLKLKILNDDDSVRETEFYKSPSKKEIETIVAAMNSLKKIDKENDDDESPFAEE